MKLSVPGRGGSADDSSRNRLALPLASFLNDLAWELPVLLLPLFVVNVLNAGPIAVGVVEGVADATGTVSKIFSGILADRTGERKRITAGGYVLANLARPLFFISGAWPAIVAIRFIERVGKGLRTSARDALMADSLSEGEMGRGFGLLRAMDTLGAFGSLFLGMLVIWLAQGDAVKLHENTFKILVAIATVPGLAAVAVVFFLAREVPVRKRTGLDLNAREGLSGSFFAFTAVTAVFTLANSSDAFLILRSQGLGGTTLVIVALMTGFNLVYAAASRPIGGLSDRVGKRRIIVLGWLLYAAVYLGFARAQGLWQVALLLIPYGFYYAMTEGIGRALVADMVPSGSRGVAYGVYHGALGASALLASIIAGALYAISPAAPFYLGAVLAVTAAGLLLLLVPATHGSQPQSESA
jgi:MFS family permease